jgi:hypothetical protein
LADVGGRRGNGVCAVNDELRGVGSVGGAVGVGVVDDLEGVVGAAGDVTGDGPAVAARVGEALCEAIALVHCCLAKMFRACLRAT